jgi:hypothetical protein
MEDSRVAVHTQCRGVPNQPTNQEASKTIYPANNAAFPPAAVVLIVTVCSAQKRSK